MSDPIRGERKGGRRSTAPLSFPLRAAPRRSSGVVDRGWGVSLLILLTYYLVLFGVGTLLVLYVPVARQAFIAPIALPAPVGAAGILDWSPAGAGAPPFTLADAADRSVTTALVILGTLLLMLPVAWVYRSTRGPGADGSLIQSLIILPLVVAGIVIVVKNSLALAFSLAGIVAAVRFRNTLKDPRDAVYIFLALGLGLSAGVQALDVALVVSFGFNIVVLVLAALAVGGSANAAPAAEGWAVGDVSVLSARREARRASHRAAFDDGGGEGLDADGLLLVHTADSGRVLPALEEAVAESAKEWRVLGTQTGEDGLETVEILLRLKKRSDPGELLEAVDQCAPDQVAAAEYIPVDNIVVRE